MERAAVKMLLIPFVMHRMQHRIRPGKGSDPIQKKEAHFSAKAGRLQKKLCK